MKVYRIEIECDLVVVEYCSQKVMEEEQKLQWEYRSLVSNQTMIWLSDGTAYYERDINEIEINEKDMIDQVIDRVILDRPARHLMNIEIIYTDKKSEKFTYDTFRYRTV